MKAMISWVKNFLVRKKRDAIWWAVLLLAFPLIQKWQTRDLISENQLAPSFTMTDTNGKEHSLSEYRGKPVVIYFFAPWCTVCKATSSNVSYLRKLRDPENLVVLSVGLSYQEKNEIPAFAKSHGLENMPVLLGSGAIENEYKISAFPTFYFIDEKGHVTGTSTGYTTTVGLLYRSL